MNGFYVLLQDLIWYLLSVHASWSLFISREKENKVCSTYGYVSSCWKCETSGCGIEPSFLTLFSYWMFYDWHGQLWAWWNFPVSMASGTIMFKFLKCETCGCVELILAQLHVVTLSFLLNISWLAWSALSLVEISVANVNCRDIGLILYNHQEWPECTDWLCNKKIHTWVTRDLFTGFSNALSSKRSYIQCAITSAACTRQYKNTADAKICKTDLPFWIWNIPLRISG